MVSSSTDRRWPRWASACALLLFSAATWAVDMQISQLLDTPDPAVRGGTITYSISLLNSNNDTADNVVLTVPLPATSSFVSTNNPACTHDAMTPGTVTCNLGSITGDGMGGPITAIDVVVQTSAASGVTVDVTADVTTTSFDVNLANNTGMQTTTINDGADLVTTKTDVADPVIAGGNISYTVSVQNLGPNDAGVTTVVDTLPPDVTFGSAMGTGWICTNVGQDVTCIRGAGIMNGATAPDITIAGQVTGAVNGTITNSVTASSVTGDPDPNNNTTTEDTFIDIGADLAVTKTVTPNPATGSAPAVFTLSPRNNGPFDAQNAVVTDTLPAGFTFVGANGGAGWACGEAGGVVTCTRATFTVGTIDDITIDTIAPAMGPFTNNVDITSATADAIPGNNADMLTANIIPDGADLSIAKSKTPNPVAQGSPITSTIVVTNNGPQATSGVLTVTDVLDPGETFVSAVGTNWTCTDDGMMPGTVTCTYSATPLAGGASTTGVTIITTATGVGLLTNTASVTDVGGTLDPIPANNTTTASTLSTAMIADLQITKSGTTPNADTTLDITENSITYTLVVTNNGPNPVGGVVVTDTIPGFVSGVVGAVPNTTVVGASDDSGGKFTCATGATVTCTTLVGQTLANAEVVTFTITVDRPLDGGVQNNTASVTSTLLGDDDLTNNSATASITVDPIADVEVTTKVITPATVEAGTNATYVITFRNNGPAAADNVQLSDVFVPPAGRSFSLISATPSKGACGVLVGNTVDCNIGMLARDEVQTVALVIRPAWDVMNDNWMLPNTATISTTTTESNAGNNV